MMRATPLLLLFLPCLLCCGRKKDDARPEDPRPLEATVAVSPGVPVALAPPSGARYGVEIRTLTDAGVGPVPLLIQLTAQLDVVRVKDAAQPTWALRLVDVALTDHSGRPLQGAEELGRELQQPFACVIEDGLVRAYYDPPGVTRQSAGYRGQLGALFQMARASSASPPETPEWDATGLASVTFRALDGGKYRYQKLRYDKLVLSRTGDGRDIDASGVTPRVTSSSGELRVDAAGLVELRRHEALSVRLKGTRSLDSTVDVKLLRASEAPAEFSIEDLLSPERRREPGVAPSGKQAALFDEMLAAGKSFADLEAALRAAPAVGLPGSASERAPLLRALASLLRVNRDALTAASRAALLANTSDDFVLEALAMASTAESLAVLERMATGKTRPPLPEPRRLKAASAAIRAPHPGAAGFRLAEALFQTKGLEQHALLGLGTFIRHFREDGDEELAKKGCAILRARLGDARTPARIKDTLLAVANSGDESLLTVVEPFLLSEDESVRDAALQATRLMPSPRIEVLIVPFLAGPPSDVRSALHALARRASLQPTTLNAAYGLARDHKDPSVRREAVLMLASFRMEHAKVSAQLQELRQNETEKSVLEAFPSPG